MLIELPVRQRGQCCQVDTELSVAIAAETVGVLKALADPTRLQIVAALLRSREPVCVCDLTAAFRLSQGTISHHVGKLRAAGLVVAEKRGIWSYYQLSPGLPRPVRELLEAATQPAG